MAKMTRALAVSGLVVAATWGSGAVHAQRTAGLNTTQTIQISSATKALDLGTDPNSPNPPNWTDINFDDSSWQPATQVPSDVASCASSTNSELATLQSSLYWGANEGDNYLFRQTFTLPKAKSYYGSTLTIGAYYGNSYGVAFYLNASDTNNPTANLSGNNEYQRIAVGQDLHPGVNVIAINTDASNDTTSSNQSCSALNFTMNLVMTDVQTQNNSTQQKQATMATTLPGSNAILTGNSLPFSWNRYNGASYYYLQMWMDNAGSGQRITSRTTTTYTARLTGTSFNLNVNHFAKGTYSWRMAAVGGAGNLLTVWTPDQRITLR